jgi:hypothetical protein
MTMREMLANAMASVVAQKQVVEGVNEPSAPFDALYRIDLKINFRSFDDDQHRIAAEHWCCRNTRGRWFRRVLTEVGVARFEFENLNEAIMFRLAN